ncbi:nitroreductase family protein [Halieaceae bacterium IMCC14734]|uniref:Nitroreductase family protein n=2 Tax=Candidatus Litorirhabdus singularis TaxID=2518993 RepID=A0ABT3TBG9_9GAMM|nr:nitroreductase family protein [Candidatus Litorirhabdus singularis]
MGPQWPETAMPEYSKRDDSDDSWLDLESVDRVLSSARSVRRKLDFERPIEPRVLLDCIDIATQAPLGLGGESWRFIVVTEAHSKQRIAEVYRDVMGTLQSELSLQVKPTQQSLMDRLHEMPALVFVCYSGAAPASELAGQVGLFGSVLPAAWSLMLALRARGIGATWTSLLASRQAEVAEILDIPNGVMQMVMLPVGYLKQATLRRASRKPPQQVTYWESYGQTRE